MQIEKTRIKKREDKKKGKKKRVNGVKLWEYKNEKSFDLENLIFSVDSNWLLNAYCQIIGANRKKRMYTMGFTGKFLLIIGAFLIQFNGE